ncbi:DMT family transporter [Luteibaculum oceani]|uniref:DMT family transporter n=1 Tax=Luteibaculum oceani TaxID=1294296 RepID=A0A5C6VJK1_9FLAO|nr:DMT family transporter [Luteibaculum oceani]TXC85100.1 DMT family transporter [Luteibaculum oceani]
MTNSRAMPKKTNAYLLLHLTVFLFGFTGVLGKLISVGSSDIVWYRMGIAAIALGLYLVSFPKPKIPSESFPKVLATGAVIAIHWIFFFEAVKQSSVSVALVGVTSSTLFTALLSPLFTKRKILAYEVLLGIMVLVGIGVIFQISTSFRVGIILSVIAAALASVFTLINEQFIRSLAPSRVSFWEMAAGWAAVTLYFIFSGKFDAQFFSISTEDLLWLLVLGVACTAFAFVASIRVMEHLPAFTVSISINLEPIYAILLAFVIFEEYELWNFSFVIGATIIIASILLNSIIKKRLKQKAKLNT